MIADTAWTSFGAKHVSRDKRFLITRARRGGYTLLDLHTQHEYATRSMIDAKEAARDLSKKRRR